jgi:hypothetical protein
MRRIGWAIITTMLIALALPAGVFVGSLPHASAKSLRQAAGNPSETAPLPEVAETHDPAPPAAAADIIWGVNGHPFTAYPGLSLNEQLDALLKLGATHYRVNLKPDGSMPDLDRLLAAAEARGLTILPIVSADVLLNKDDAKTMYRRARDIGLRLAKRYAGRIKVWELGNELENYAILQPCEMRDDGTQYPCAWGAAGGMGPLDYFGARWKKVSAILRGLSDGVHAGDPTALRAIGTAGWGHSGAFDRLAADAVGWDISVWHQYERGQDLQLAHVASFGKPIWITEFNHPNGSRDGEDLQARGVAAMMQDYRDRQARYRIEAAFIYELFDEPYWDGYEASMGLVRQAKNDRGVWRPAKQKPAFDAMRDMIAARRAPSPDRGD